MTTRDIINNPEPLSPLATRLALRLREAARALSVSERTLWEWTQHGDVPHVRRGKTVLYPVDALRRWLDEQARMKTAAEGTEQTHGFG